MEDDSNDHITHKSARESALHTLFDEKELEVSDILLNLECLICESESENGLSIKWGSKKRRSAIDSVPGPHRRLRSSSCLQRQSMEEMRDTGRMSKMKSTIASPSTPLFFPPSESDDKSKHSLNKSSKKRSRKGWLKVIDELTQRKELLTREVDVVRRYYSKLLTFNLTLNTKKVELDSYLEKKRPKLKIRSGV